MAAWIADVSSVDLSPLAPKSLTLITSLSLLATERATAVVDADERNCRLLIAPVADVAPVPPLATERDPKVIFEPLRLVSPEPLPVKVFEPTLILPKPLPIEPEVRVPTVARVEAEVRAGNEARLPALVRPAKVVIFGREVVADTTAMAVVEARELVKYRFVPSATLVVKRPSEDVATCCKAPVPLPRRI